MKKIFVTGFLQTTSPLHITAPSKDRFDPSTGEICWGADKGVPCTSTQKIGIPAIFTPKKNKEDEEQADSYSSTSKIPVIAGNNLSGHIRDHVGNVFLEALRDSGQRVDMTTYSAIMSGAATGSPDGAPITYDEYKKATKHPLLGLLGGGPRMIHREAKIDNAIAVCKESESLLARNRVPYENIYDGWDTLLETHNSAVLARNLCGAWGYKRLDDLKELANIELAEETITGFTKAFNERQAKIIEEFHQGKDESNTKTSIGTYQGLEFVCPGVSFPFVAKLHKLTDVQAGLWIRGFERFVKNVSLGGWSRCGFGDFVFTDGRISIFEDDELVSCETFDPSSKEENEDSFRAKTAAAWASESEKLVGGDLNFLMRLPAEKKDKKDKKAKGAAKEVAD